MLIPLSSPEWKCSNGKESWSSDTFYCLGSTVSSWLCCVVVVVVVFWLNCLWFSVDRNSDARIPWLQIESNDLRRRLLRQVPGGGRSQSGARQVSRWRLEHPIHFYGERGEFTDRSPCPNLHNPWLKLNVGQIRSSLLLLCFYTLDQGRHTHLHRGPHRHHGRLLKGRCNWSAVETTPEHIVKQLSLHLIIVHSSVKILYTRTFP